MLSSRGIAKKVIAHASDGGGNLSAMRESLKLAVGKEEGLAGGALLPSSCMAHAVNNSCNAAMKQDLYEGSHVRPGSKGEPKCARAELSVALSLKKLHAIGAYIKKSSAGQRYWASACEAASERCARLPAPVKARFVTRVRHMEKALEKRSAIAELGRACSKLKSKPKSIAGLSELSEQDWATAKCIADALLHPANAVTSLQGYESLSAMIMRVMRARAQAIGHKANLSKEIKEFDDALEGGSQGNVNEVNRSEEELTRMSRMRDAAADYLAPHLEEILLCHKEKEHLLASLILDPRAHNLGMRAGMAEKMGCAREMAHSSAKTCINFFLAPLAEKLWKSSLEGACRKGSGKEGEDKADEDPEAWHGESEGAFGKESSNGESFGAQLKLERASFLSKARQAGKQADPLSWRLENAGAFPRLSLAAKAALSMPPAAIESERALSIAGALSLARRNRASAELLGISAMIYCNFEEGSKKEGQNEEDLRVDGVDEGILEEDGLLL